MNLCRKIALTSAFFATVLLSSMSMTDGQALAPVKPLVVAEIVSRGDMEPMPQQRVQQQEQKEFRQELPVEVKPQPPKPKPVEVQKPKEVYGSWLNFQATFYTLAEGSGTGRTATGTIPTAGRTLAVDPNMIPLGSIVEIQYADGSIERRVAEDTGGAIHGNILDVYVVTQSEAIQRGRQGVKLRIVYPNN